MSATVRQIAAQAHVSPSTVSRVLNKNPRVDEATRQQVLRIAEQLGYPLPDGQRVANPSRAVLVLLRDIGQPNDPAAAMTARGFEYDVYSGMQPVFEQRGIAIRMQRTRMAAGDARSYTQDPAVSGLALLGGIQDHGFVEELQTLGVPFIAIGAHLQPLHVNCVAADYVGGMRQAVEHLIARGRRRIGLVNGPSTTTSSRDKYDGFRLALALHDLPFDPAGVVTGDFDAESGYVQTSDLLKRRPDLDAIAYPMDDTAFGGLRALKESGRRVPDDVAVTGFYNHDLARFTDPPLTSVHIDWIQAGSLAARRLCMVMDEHDPNPWLIMLPACLVARGST
jgi:DNA-binding LacI/PurR family transcriptional regulator